MEDALQIPLKLNRKFFATEMPDNMKKGFILAITHTPYIPYYDKTFICDNIHNYEKIDDDAKRHLLDVLDELNLFSIDTPKNKICG